MVWSLDSAKTFLKNIIVMNSIPTTLWFLAVAYVLFDVLDHAPVKDMRSIAWSNNKWGDNAVTVNTQN